jgi:hypothetical protein
MHLDLLDPVKSLCHYMLEVTSRTLAHSPILWRETKLAIYDRAGRAALWEMHSCFLECLQGVEGTAHRENGL